MIVFKTYFKILNKLKFPIILYTSILIFFSIFNIQTSDSSNNFIATKADVAIINHDEYKGITKNVIDFMKKNNNVIKIKDNNFNLEDALFYRDVNFIIIIPKNFRNDFLNNKKPIIEIKKTGDYNASLAEMYLNKYLKTANIYLNVTKNEEELINYIEKSLSNNTKVEIISKLDTIALNRASFYFNFLNYCILAGFIYAISLIICSFKDEKIRKRTTVSSMNYKNYNLKLLFSNSIFALVLWLFYVLLGFVILGDVLVSINGLLYFVNSFIFSICALSIAFLLSNLVSRKNAINGIVNIIALGSCFLCGAFVPMELLPKTVLKIAHILPSYWYIKSNEVIKTLDKFNFMSLKPILINLIIILIFTILFIIITNVIAYKKRKID